MTTRDYELDVAVTLDRDPTDKDVEVAERIFQEEWSCTGAESSADNTISLFGNGETADSTATCHARLVHRLRAAFPTCGVRTCWHERPEPEEHETDAGRQPAEVRP